VAVSTKITVFWDVIEWSKNLEFFLKKL